MDDESLGGGRFSNIFGNFHPENWGRWFPIRLIFFKGVETTNQLIIMSSQGVFFKTRQLAHMVLGPFFPERMTHHFLGIFLCPASLPPQYLRARRPPNAMPRWLATSRQFNDFRMKVDSGEKLVEVDHPPKYRGFGKGNSNFSRWRFWRGMEKNSWNIFGCT